MKAVQLTLILCSLLASSSNAISQLINGRFSVSVYGWEKFDTVGSSEHLTRGFSSLQLDVTQRDISFHTYLSAASQLSGSFGDEALVRVSNAFLRVRNIGNFLDVNLGRVPVFAGAGIGTVDGALVKAKGWNEQVRFTAYGGANVPSDLRSHGFDDIDKNFFIGGQIIGSFFDRTLIGASYVNRHIKPEDYLTVRPDSQFNPIAVFVTPEVRSEQVGGVDASYTYSGKYSVYTRYEYDINMKRSLRAEARAGVNLTPDCVLSGTYIYREPRMLYNSFFWWIPAEPVREYEGGLEYTFPSSISAFARFAYVKYSDDMSRRLTMGIGFPYASVRFSGSNGYSGRLASVYVQGMYPLMQRMIVPTIGLSYAAYRLEEGASTREDMFAVSCGIVARPAGSFSGDAQVQWLRNKIAENDVRVAAKLSYWFSYNLSPAREKEEEK